MLDDENLTEKDFANSCPEDIFDLTSSQDESGLMGSGLIEKQIVGKQLRWIQADLLEGFDAFDGLHLSILHLPPATSFFFTVDLGRILTGQLMLIEQLTKEKAEETVLNEELKSRLQAMDDKKEPRETLTNIFLEEAGQEVSWNGLEEAKEEVLMLEMEDNGCDEESEEVDTTLRSL